ncbi:MAG: TrkA family potassium uptake protein [Candidatus Promineofilum sp.]|nr:TrkA family potassium uptake protein [Promineifilum sp.]
MADKRVKNDFVIIGLDSFGENLALSLQELGHHVLGIDRNREVVQRLTDNIRELAILDASDYETMASIGVDAFDVAIVAIGGDIAQSVLITLTLKELGIKRVMCEAQSERDRRVLLRIGADDVVTPDIESAHAVAYQLTSHVPQATHLRFGNQVAIKWRPPYPYQGTVGELMAGYPDDISVLLMAGRDIIYNPPPETPVAHNDELLVSGSEESISIMREESRHRA